MPDLEEHQKLFIIERLAQFKSYGQIRKSLKADFGLDVPEQNIAAYKPGTVAGDRMSDEHKQLFQRLREAFLQGREEFGLAHSAYRLSRLQQLIDDPLLSQNPELVKSIVEMAEKMDGGMYRQRQNGASPDEVGAYVGALAADLRRAVAEFVTNPQERTSVFAAIEKRLENDGQSGSS